MALETNVPTNPYRDPTGTLEGSRDTGEGIVISTEPDICLTPSGGTMVPVGYNLWAQQADDARTTPTVKLTSLRSHNMGSFITTCHGDEAGTGGGVKSGTHNGICEPKGHSENVYSEGKQMIRHTDEWWMNNKNTVGKLIYVKDAGDYGRWFEAKAGQTQVAEADTGTKSDAPPTALGLMAPASAAAQQAAKELAQRALLQAEAEVVAAEATESLAARAGAAGLIGSEWGPLEWAGAAVVVGGIALVGGIQLRNALKAKAEAEAKLKEIEKQQQEQTKSIVRVTGEEEDPKKCCIAPHSVNKNGGCAACKPGQSAQSHHGMIDYPFRTGTQASEGHTAPGSPGRENALTVCVPGPDDETGENEHGALHRGGLNSDVRASGQNGLTTFAAVRQASFDGIDRIGDTTLSPACKALYKKLLDAQYKMPAEMPLRANPSPLPNANNDVGKALSQAWGFKW